MARTEVISIRFSPILFFILYIVSFNVDAKNCTIGKPCGNTCISMSYVCHIDTPIYIPLTSQTIGTISFSQATLAIGGTTTASATVTSGLAVTFSSTTPSVCTVSGSTVTGTTGGTCIIAANQVGNSNYAAATQVTMDIHVGAAVPYMGLWWNPSESGWGMSITQHGSTIFAVPFTYDSTGQPTWYVMSSCPIGTAGSCAGDLYKVSGGSSPAVPWNGLGKAVSSAGTGMLTFADANHGHFDYILNGVSASKTIERQLFSNGTPQFGVDYADLWWNANESGWGVSLTQDHGMLFAAWYAYDASGKAIWLVASNCPLSSAASGNGCTGPLYQVTGGSPLTSPWNPNIVATPVGSVTFTFFDASNGTMTYTLNGVAGTRNITRQPF